MIATRARTLLPPSGRMMDQSEDEAVNRSRRQTLEPAPIGIPIDRTGMVISCLCAVHCALLPIVAGILPLIGLGLLAAEETETALMGSSVALGSIGLGLGYGRHRSSRALVVLAIGMALLIAGRVAEASDAGAPAKVAAVAGGLAIAGAHLINLRLCRSCPECREAAPAGVGRPEGLIAPGSPTPSNPDAETVAP
jgi:MerC mercury resistance protein